MVKSHLDYCISVFTSLPADQIAWLQRVQNNAARLAIKNKIKIKIKKRSRNTTSQGTSLAARKIPLPERDRDSCLPTFAYLSSSLGTYEPSRSLRSSSEKWVKIPKRNLKSFGERSFSFIAPSASSLPATPSCLSSNLTSKPSCLPKLSSRV